MRFHRRLIDQMEITSDAPFRVMLLVNDREGKEDVVL